jgi:hypothetical protein
VAHRLKTGARLTRIGRAVAATAGVGIAWRAEQELAPGSGGTAPKAVARAMPSIPRKRT